MPASKSKSEYAAMAAAIALILLFLMGVIVFLYDKGLPTKTAVALVEEKQVIPARATMVYAGKTAIATNSPESYQLRFKVDETQVTAIVEKEFFEKIQIGQEVEVDLLGPKGNYEAISVRLLPEKSNGT